jgi:hypothetical protein
MHCNAELPVDATTCPRCGEGGPVVVERPEDERRRPSNRQLGLIVLASMATMAAIGLVFALMTTEQRRANDNKNVETSRPPGPINVAPTELAGLGFIPGDVDALAGVDLDRMRESDSGRELLRRVELLPEAMLTPAVSHIVVGGSFREFPPRLTMVLRSPSSADCAQVRSALTTDGTQVRGERRLSKARLLRRAPIESWLADAGPLTLIGSQLPADFDAVPTAPQSGTRRFARLERLLVERLPRNAAMWFVAEVEPSNTVLPFLVKMLPWPKAEVAVWERLRGVVVAIRPVGTDFDATLDVKGSDASATAALGDSAERAVGAAGVMVQRRNEGDWQRLSARIDGPTLQRWLGAGRGAAEAVVR